MKKNSLNNVKKSEKSLATTIKEERKKLGLTQTELGALANSGINFISQLESGKRSVRLDKLLVVLNVLGLEIHIARGKNSIVIAKDL